MATVFIVKNNKTGKYITRSSRWATPAVGKLPQLFETRLYAQEALDDIIVAINASVSNAQGAVTNTLAEVKKAEKVVAKAHATLQTALATGSKAIAASFQKEYVRALDRELNTQKGLSQYKGELTKALKVQEQADFSIYAVVLP